MCADTSAAIRTLGLEAMAATEVDGSVALLFAALDDIARSVRETAQYHLLARAKNGSLGSRPDALDFAAHYRAGVQCVNAKIGSIRGLAAAGATNDWEILVPLLDASPARARAAIEAMYALAPSDTRELQLIMVEDPRPGVSRAAAHSLRRVVREVDAPTLQRYLRSPIAHVRINAVALVSQLPGWQPMRLWLAVDDVSLAQSISREVGIWLARNRSYASPDGVEIAALRAAVETSVLSVESRAQLSRFFWELVGPVCAESR